MSVIRHAAWSAASAVLFTASRFGLTAILARRLGTEEFGLYTYALWLIDMSFLVCALGATGVISRFLPEFRSNPPLVVALIRRWRPYSFGLPLAGALAAAMAARFSGVGEDMSTLLVLLAWGFFTGLRGMHSAALVGLQRFDLIFVANATSATILLLGAAFAPISPGSLIAVFGVMASASGISALVGLRAIAGVARGAAGTLQREQMQSIFRYALNVWLTALLWNVVYSRGEVPMIRATLGDAEVAHYAVALTLYSGAVAGVMLGVSGVAPQVTRYWGEGKEEAAVALCRRTMDLQLLLSGIAALTLVWLGSELMQGAFGVQYRASGALLGILALGLPSLSLAAPNFLMQIATNARYTRNNTMVGVVALMASAAFGISVLGISGAAWARSSTLILVAAITVAASSRRWGKGAIGGRNVVVILGISVASLVCATSTLFEPLPIRLTMLALTTIAALVLVRDRAHKAVAPLLAELLLSRLRKSAR